MKIAIYFLGCFSALSLIAAEPTPPESSAVSSTHAAYDGNALHLTGRVALDHGLGKMVAEEASLQKQEVGKDFPFSLITLKKEVKLSLKSSAELLCETADLDFNLLTGVLHSKEEEKVVYSDTFKKKKEAFPFKLAGKRIELLFTKNLYEGKYDYDIETVLVKEDVEIEYAQGFHLHADHALYRKQNGLSSESKEFQGVITAYPKEEGARCRLTRGPDLIDADTIDLNMVDSTLSLLHPKGVLSSSFVKEQTEPMRFSADQLFWNHASGTLTLNGHIFMEEAALGTINAAKQLKLQYKSVKDKQLLKRVQAQGETLFTYSDPSFARPHKLLSHGKMEIDRDKLLVSLESPPGVSDKQLYYEEEEIGVFADRALLEYAESQDLLKPISLQLKGNIRLFSHDPKQPPRCGIADRLHYSLETGTLILLANPGSNVLFWDEAQGLRMSASEIHITYEAQSRERTIKGVGKVQLTLTSEEQQRLKQLFPHYKVAL